MEGIVDVYEQYFMNEDDLKVIDLSKRRNHSCLVCSTEPKNGSYGKNDRFDITKVVVGYLEHLKVFGFSSKLALLFIDSVRDSGALCNKVKGFWELKEHKTSYVFILEHSTEGGNEISSPVISSFITKRLNDLIEEKEKEKKDHD